MVGCCAFGCSNRSERGFLMKAFPTDPNRRETWAAKVKRENWTPTNSSRLCEIHFEPEMWEKTREDGKRILKHNAIPTIFSFSVPKRRRPPIKRRNPTIHLPTPENGTIEAQPCTSTERTENKESSSSTTLSPQRSVLPMEEKLQLNNKLRQYETAYRKLLHKTKKYRNQIRALKRKNKRCNSEDEQLLRKIFNDDQILALRRKSTKFMKWSNSTMMRAIKLKLSCGTSGYEELLRQKIPLPSLRTINI